VFPTLIYILPVLLTGQPVGIYSAPLKEVVQKLPFTSSYDSAKFELTLGDLMSTKTVVRTDVQGCRVVI
jgi:vacuolar protein sorting-associated protein 13A/C